MTHLVATGSPGMALAKHKTSRFGASHGSTKIRGKRTVDLIPTSKFADSTTTLRVVTTSQNTETKEQLLMTFAVILVAILLFLGVVVRKSIKLFEWLYIPASVVAGLIGLAVVQACLKIEYTQTVATSVSATLSNWPGWLIAVVFAGMLLERKNSSGLESAKRVARQGIMVWVIVLGQAAIGLLVTWLLIQRYYDVPNSIGMLIETGFAGGHGTAAAMGQVFAHDSINLAGGKDLGMLMATCGLVYGILSGILWINIGVRSGWIPQSQRPNNSTSAQLKPIGLARIDGETIDPLLLQIVWLTLAFGIGLALQTLVMNSAAWIDGALASSEALDEANKELSQRVSVSNVLDFPPFIYTLFGGLIVRKLLHAIGWADRIDGQSINRLTSTAMDILVVAAIATLNLQAVAALLVPFSILFVAGCIWTAICLLIISRALLPKDRWFQLGLINYGMSTGTTATGFVLLRMIDPDLKSGAAEDYALAAPLSAPFIGGGMLTIAMPLLFLERVPIAAAAIVLLTIVCGLIFIGRFIGKKQDETPLETG